MNITKDKAINEIIDGYDAAAVPDNLVADRLDSGGYALAKQIDTDGGNTKITATVLTAGDTLAYKKNPATTCKYGTTSTDYAGTSMTSGSAKVISSCSVGDIIEVVEFNSSGKAVAVGYTTLTASDIKA